MLEVDGLVRRYGQAIALDGMRFAVEPGSVTGFLGPNGAGKTTTMRAIFGLSALDAGTTRFDGRPIDMATRRRFGYLPEERGLYPTMRVEDSQSVAFPLMLPLLLGYIVAFTAAGGAGTLLWVLAFFPPTAVVVMPTLYAIGAAEGWMVALSMGLTVVAVVLVVDLASKIYERSVLHTGRKLSWKEAFGRQPEIVTVD